MLEDAGAFLSIGDLQPDPKNARKHNPRNVGMIEAALNEVGAARSIVIDEDGVVLAGNATIEAAAQAGIERVQVVEADGETIIAVRRRGLTQEQKARLALFDNRAAELADWDTSILAELATETDLSQLFRDDELSALLADVGQPNDIGGGGDDFDPSPSDDPTRTQVGDLWSITGNGLTHRLLVGDCTDPHVVERLMGGERAAICFTSPPYNVAADSSLPNKNKYRAARQNTSDGQPDARGEDEYLQLLSLFTALALECAEYVFVNVQSVAGNKVALIDYLHAFRESYADTIIWDKLTAEPAMAHNVLNSRYEYIHVFSQKANRAIGTRPFRGTLENILPMNSRQDKEYSDVHRATFPLDFVSHFVENFMNRGEIVLDPFGGTGTTLVAAHRASCVARLCEVSPAFADLALARAEAAGLTCVRVE